MGQLYRSSFVLLGSYLALTPVLPVQRLFGNRNPHFAREDMMQELLTESALD